MSDQTVYAEALIGAVARAFYEDEHILLVDTMIRDKYLRDDDMGPRLSLPAKQLRRSLQFLLEEQIVKFELVDDLREGGSQTTKYWYIDYNHAVNVIRLRVFLLKRKLEQAELRARSSSVYLCPGYKEKRCNGKYTETEAQQIVDTESGLFLCQECYKANESNPDAIPRDTYTLRLIDNTRDLRLAVDNARRVQVQLSGKMIGNQVLRPGIYELLQKVRSKGSGPLTSNLPSENIALEIGSKRIAGTGRTAGIRAKKLEKQAAEAAARGEGVGGGPGGAVQRYLNGTGEDDADLNFLKNAMGQEVAFQLEKGGGARANLLAKSMSGQQRSKLLDAAASRVGIEVDPETELTLGRKRAREKAAASKDGLGDDDDDSDSSDSGEANGKKRAKKTSSSGKKKKAAVQTLDFLIDNIGRGVAADDSERYGKIKEEDEDSNLDDSDNEDGNFVLDATDEFRRLPEQERKLLFMARYREELARQLKLLAETASLGMAGDEEDDSIEWEEG